MCVLTYERYKTYQTGFLFCPLSHALGVGRLKIKFRLAVCPLCYLLLNRWTKFNQVWCVSYSHEWGVQRQSYCGPTLWGPGEGSKGQISFNFNYKVYSKIFMTNFVCVPTNERYKTYQTGVLFYCLGHALGVGLGVFRGQKSNSVLLSVRYVISS